ncbi:nitroreductase family protein [Planctomycetota bacterium]
MALLEVIKKRYSCRSYLEKDIEQEKLDEIFEAARLAPSAKNLQDWRFVVVTDKVIKAELATATNRPPLFSKAGAIIVACSNNDYVMKCGQAIGPIDVSIALEHISLQATELDLATCWIGSFDTQKVKEVLGIPVDINIIELMALGYPSEEGKQNKREPLENILCYNKWQF